jgi:hypothetical protein
MISYDTINEINDRLEKREREVYIAKLEHEITKSMCTREDLNIFKSELIFLIRQELIAHQKYFYRNQPKKKEDSTLKEFKCFVYGITIASIIFAILSYLCK